VAKRFVLIDRDGTLIVEKHYLCDPDEVELISGAAAALKQLQDADWGICVVTNQSGVARGYFDMGQLGKVHRKLEEVLAQFDVRLDGIYVCPHAPDAECNCRKPLPGMIQQAIAAHRFDPREAWVVGDKETDVALGHAAGARSILVRTGYGKRHESDTKADFVVDDLSAAADLIIDRSN
jgi:D-glycero-D-manno-heptose 1,7-bisphosphate phosphatase